ncbi:hypothetical protein [Microcystis phage Mwe-JY26]
MLKAEELRQAIKSFLTENLRIDLMVSTENKHYDSSEQLVVKVFLRLEGEEVAFASVEDYTTIHRPASGSW